MGVELRIATTDMNISGVFRSVFTGDFNRDYFEDHWGNVRMVLIEQQKTDIAA